MENTLLNLVPASYLPEVHLSQYDVGRELKFTLKDGSSDYSVPSGAVVTVKATKPSGLGFVVNAVADGNVVTLSSTETMTNENGRFPAELSITQGSTVIGTSNFIFNIERSPHPEGTIDGDAESLLPELTLLVERIEAAADSVDEDTQIVTEAKDEALQAKADTLQAKADTLTARDDAVSAKDLAVSSAQTSVEASERAEELVGSVETKADAIVKTASGEIASFSDGGDDLPMKSLKVNIVPKQSGSGDPSPSNVRPISGWDSVDVNKTGVNIWDEEWEVGGLNTTTGETTSQTDRIRSKNYIPIVDGAEYRFVNGSINLVALLYDHNKTYIGRYYYFKDTQPILDSIDTIGCGYIKFYMTSAYGTTYNNDISINYPATDTSYHIGANNESYPISLPQTVYSGVLDVVSGELTIDRGSIDMGAVTWIYGNGGFYANMSTVPITPKDLFNGICSCYKYGGAYNVCQNNQFGYIFNNVPYVKDSRYTDATAFKTAMNGQTMVVELATPIEIQLTPTEVKTLLGSNNIWSDSGSVEVEYRADTTLAYEELANAIISLGGNI